MPTMTLDICLPVSDFLEEAGNDREEAFELAAAASGAAAGIARAEVAEALGDRASRVTVGRAAFCEFDASNVGHAGAHWNVEFSSDDPALLDEVARHLEATGDAAPAP